MSKDYRIIEDGNGEFFLQAYEGKSFFGKKEKWRGWGHRHKTLEDAKYSVAQFRNSAKKREDSDIIKQIHEV